MNSVAREIKPYREESALIWDELTFDELIEEASDKLQNMFKVTYEAVEILSYIEDRQRWKDHPQYEDKIFKVFLYDYFGMSLYKYEIYRDIAVEFGHKIVSDVGFKHLQKFETYKVPPQEKQAIIKDWNQVIKTRKHLPTSKIDKSFEPYKGDKESKPKYFDTFCPNCKYKIRVDKKTHEVFRGPEK